ncbi:hypothetical protein PsorP6_009870 [Peronosclerospora sorghi]|uniref:Uncharacterized protein n=1 Tax=Peronosclerospora sorghi TaxID=230839 RepID=A0ACC0VX47_9STRA|nr:hypothetical protein PsorP6_009870 [Peronosclerospora sorghi]
MQPRWQHAMSRPLTRTRHDVYIIPLYPHYDDVVSRSSRRFSRAITSSRKYAARKLLLLKKTAQGFIPNFHHFYWLGASHA